MSIDIGSLVEKRWTYVSVNLENRKVCDVVIRDAALGTSYIQGRRASVIRGEIDPQYFGALVIPTYQRIAMLNEKHDELVEALGPDGIGVPDDLLLCCRDSHFRPVPGGHVALRTTGLVVLDGHQRFRAGMARLSERRQTHPFGVKIFLETTEREEIRAFHQVNRKQTKVSTQVLLRNEDDNPAIDALKRAERLNPGFPQVRWDQLKSSGDLITAHILYETATMLHGYRRGADFEQLLENLEETAKVIGTEMMAQNVLTFFDVVRTALAGKPQLERVMYRRDLLGGLAQLFSQYEDFWDAKNPRKLLVRITDIRKIGSIRWNDLENSLSRTGAANNVTYAFMRHIDKGRDIKLRERQ